MVDERVQHTVFSQHEADDVFYLYRMILVFFTEQGPR